MELTADIWVTMALGALFVGMSKGGVPGIGNLAAPIYALTFPSSRESVGVLLPVLMSADIVAVIVYRRHAQWRHIRRLFPWVFAGVVAGFFALGRLDDTGVRKLIGVVMLGMTLVHVIRQMQGAGRDGAAVPHQPWFVRFMGGTAGFSSMTANAAGPVAQLYLLAAGLPKMAFIGTSAWFFLLMNWVKVPFMTGLGLIHSESLWISVRLMPAAVFGALIGPLIVRRINQKTFTMLIWFFVVLAGVRLLF